jgi:hypothetical protein
LFFAGVCVFGLKDEKIFGIKKTLIIKKNKLDFPKINKNIKD